MSAIITWFNNLFISKKYKCQWCSKSFTIPYEPRKDFIPLCSDSCTASYFAKNVSST